MSAFRPAWWLPGPHAQTLWPVLFHRPVRPALAPETLELPDGDFVDLLWTAPGSGPVVAILHGLEGGIHSHYAPGMLAAIHAAGWQAVFMYFRGCSGRHNRLARSYHSGDTGDIGFLLDTLRARFPGARLAAVGFSLGGNALLKYLGEGAGRTILSSAVAVSVPFLLAAGADRLNRGFSRVYQRHLLRRLRRKIRDKFGANRKADAPIALDLVPSLDSFWRFDDAVTAPLHGFSGVDDYYRRSSCRPYLRGIEIPTLIIHALDDPFLSPEAVPGPAELAKNVTLELSPRGGHVGFIAGGAPCSAKYWLESRVTDYLRNHLQ